MLYLKKAGALSARKFCDITVKPEVNNAECAGNLVYFAVNIVKIMCFKTFLDFRKIFHHPGEDIPFINSVVNLIYHMENGELNRYVGDYNKFLELYEIKKSQLNAAQDVLP